ncbi:MAG: InlB B-repeat-containing protein [Bacteroidales bacterium]|nr:InlB B-repeat-containing protein [Bacteroidales bacterium]
MHRKPVQTIIVMLLAAIFTTPAWGQSLCTPIVVADNTSIYTPTQIFNGSFDEEPWMVFTYNNVTYNTCPNNPNFDSGGNKYATNVVFHGVDEGWNTTELSWWRGTLFEYTDGSSTHNCQHNSTILMSDKYVEMNCYHATMLYQDLTTCGNDVIRWTLKHGVTSGGNEVQPMYVEIGAPNRDGNGNIINASGWADNLNPQIDVNTAAFFRYNGVTDKDNNASTRGFASESDLQYLRLTKSANYNGWWTAQGVYTIPEGQTVTRFGFVSEAQTPNSGNLLDDITFSTLIGNLTANFASTTDNTVLVKGYWGETDPTKKIKIVIGETTHELDMSNVIGQNFIITIPSTCFDGTPTQVTVYHADYENAKRILNVNYPISASATNTSGTYDGTTAYGINVTVTEPDPNASTTSGLTIKYGTTYGGCNLESLTYTNAGNYTVFYQVSADHYSNFIGSATVSIAKAASSVVTAPTSGVDMEYLNSTISLLTDGGTATGGDMVYALGTDDITPPTSGYSTSIPTGKSWGNYYVWYKVQGDANHNDSDPGVVVASITEPPTHNVTVSVRETGLGTVGINNDFTVSSTSIHTHDIVTINATPASGLTFVRWTDGNGVLQSTYNNYVATITEAIDFVADFGYNVSVNKTGNGTVRMDYTDIDNVSQTTGEVTSITQRITHSGSEVTLTATPDAHYHFKYWTNSLDDQKVTTNTLTFTPSATITYTAVFAVDTHNVSIALNDPTKGNVFIKQVTQTEDFESGSIPSSWTITGTGQWKVVSNVSGQTGSYCIKSGNAGNPNSTSTITLNINLAHNGSISFRSRISSEVGWDFGIFSIDGTQRLSKSGNEGWTTDTYEVSAGNHTFAWYYTKDNSVNKFDDVFYVDDIVIKEMVPASTEPYRYTYGQTCDILAVPKLYHHLKNWTDENDNVAGTADGKSFAVSGDTTLTANFEASQYTVTLKQGTEDADNWSFSPSTARAGETVTVTYSGTKPIRSLQCPTTYEINSSSDVTTAVNNFNSHPGSRLLFNTDITANLTFTASEGEIDFNNHTLTGYVYAQNNVLGKSITFKDGTVTGGYDGAGGWNNWYYGTVMMENINVSTNQAVWTDGHAYIFCSGNYGPIQNLTRNGADVPGTAVIYNDVTYTSLNTGNNSNWHAGQTSFLNHNATPLVDYDLMEVMPDQQCQQCRQWTFTMPGYNVEATVDYFAVLTLAADGNGTVALDGITAGITDNGNGTYTLPRGTTVTINATPAEHHYMQKWNDEAALNSNVAVSTTFTVTKDTTLTAYFVHKPTLTLNSNPTTRGTVKPEGAPNQLPAGVVQGNNANEYIVDYDTTVKVVATPIDHYHLASWNNIGGNNLTQYVTLTRDSLITGAFAIDTFTLTLKTNDQTMGTLAVVNTGNDAIVSHGTDATGTSTYKVNYGAEVIFKATANTGYHVGSWSNGATVTDLAESTQTITVTSDSTITANFAASQFTISFNSNGGTNVAPITQDYGTTIVAPANPTRENLVFDGWIPAIPSTMPAENLELTAQWNFQGSGTETDPYIIPSTDVWNLLAQKVNAGNTYENKVFLQTADISDVTNMVGSPSTMFSGTYDGGGHTITLNLPTATADDAGPFRSINGATIKNLHTAGTVDGGVYGYAGGIAGRAIGNCNLINCRSSVTITASKDGDGSHGGLVGNSTGTTIEGCIFDGRLITTNNTYNCGGLVGWSQSGTIVHNCLFAPTEFTPAMAANWSSTIGRDGGNNGANYTIINTYYTQEFGWHHQGKQVRSITGGEGVTVANAGTDTVYNVSGITTYGTGIKYNNVLYGGNGDVISLNLSHENQAGHTFNQYTVAGGGTLANSTTNNPTLTMTDADQVINVEWKADLAWQLGDQPVPIEGVSGYVGFENHVTFPTLSNPHNITVTYSSTNTDVATINATGDITFVAAGETTIKATFTGNSDYASDEVTYTLTVKNPDTLTLASNNPQWGSVTLDNASSSNTYPTSTENIYCVLPGTDVTINAAAIQLYHVASWSDEGQHDLSANASYDEYFVTNPDRFPAKSSITITMTGDTTMIATFDINIYNINAAVANGQSELGTVQVAYTDVSNQAQTIATTTTMTEVQATALKGSTTTLTAIPEAGFHFVNWTNGNVVLGTDPTLTSTEDLTATANFDTTHAELAWSEDEFTGYTMINFNNYTPTLNNPHNVNVRYGLVENVTSVKVNPETGYITNDYNVPRLITQGTYHIYAVHETDQTYYYDSVVYTLNVNWGAVVSILKNIEEGGTTAFQNAENDLTHAYSSNNAMMAYLAPGASFTVSADANEGYHFSKWQTGDNVAGYTDFATTSEATYTAPAQITSMFSIGLKAIFDTNTYALNVLSDNTEMGSVSGSNPAAKHFLNYEISATPTLGYFFDQWNDGNTDNPRTVSLISDSTFTAYFAPDTFTITYMDGDVKLKVDTFLYRQPITEYTTSKEKWRFDGWDPEVPELMPAENLTVYAIWYRLCEPLEDVDHNTYPSVNIGNKCWMAENLRTLHYYDGREITNIYEYQSSLYPNAEENVTIFGRLYDWYDAADASRPTRSTRIQGICPQGWFLPNEEDFELLNNADLHTLRSTNYWLYNNGDNSTGFDWRPSGMYNMNTQRYENLLGNAYLWSSFSTSSTEAHCHMADCNCYLIYDMITQKENAYSVRCIQD